MPFSSEPGFAVGPFGRAWRSLACTAGGWMVMIICLLLQYAQYATTSPRWYGMPLLIGIFSLPYVGAVWLMIVLPLFCFVRHHSRFWSWLYVVPLFGFAGFMVMSAFLQFRYNDFAMRITGLATLLGAATGLFSAAWQKRLGKQSLPAPASLDPENGG